MITLTLPYPISANRYWTQFRLGQRMMQAPSKEAKAYKATTVIRAKQAGITKPLTGRIALTIGLYPGLPKDAAKRMRRDPVAWDDTVRSIDLDNALKVLIDAIKGVVIDDDKWVRRIVAERFEPDGNARVVIRVEQIVGRSPQLLIEVPTVRDVSPVETWVDPFMEPVR